MKRIRWGWALLGALGAEAMLVAAAFAWVAFYSYVIHPGGASDFYRQYAMMSGPWLSLLLGLPVFYLASRLVASRTPAGAVPTVMALFGIYLLLDAPIVLLGDNPHLAWWQAPLGYAVKLLACYLGGVAKHAA